MMAERALRAMAGSRPDSLLSRTSDPDSFSGTRPAARETAGRTGARVPFAEAIAHASRAIEQQPARRSQATGPALENGPGDAVRARHDIVRARDDARVRDKSQERDDARARDPTRARDEAPARERTRAREGASAGDSERGGALEAKDKREKEADSASPPSPAPPASPAPGALPVLPFSGATRDTAVAEGDALAELRGAVAAAKGDASGEPGASATAGSAPGESPAASGSRPGSGAKPATASAGVAALQISDDADDALLSGASSRTSGSQPTADPTDSSAIPREALSEFAARLAQVAAGGPTQHGASAPAGGATLQLPLLAAPVHPGAIAAPLGDPGFSGQLAGETTSLVIAGIENAEITLQPRELGPVKIEISLNGESASIAFSAAQPDTRQAIEQSLPILKDLLAEHGLLLSEASVGDGRAEAGNGRADRDSRSAATPTREQLDGPGSGSGTGASGGAFGAPKRSRAAPRALLDLYA